MACGLALKRPHEYDSYLAGDAPSEAKRARSALCSPFRPQMGTLAASLPSCSAQPKLLVSFTISFTLDRICDCLCMKIFTALRTNKGVLKSAAHPCFVCAK